MIDRVCASLTDQVPVTGKEDAGAPVQEGGEAAV